MADEPGRKAVKVGVVVGGGPPPGYQWNVDLLQRSFDEAMSFLDEDQYAHLAAQFRELARSAEPTTSETIDVRPVEDFHELRDKGGVLKRFSVRVFFFLHKPTRTVVVLGTINKQNDGPTPNGTKIQMRRRKRLYLEGLESGEPE